jgi:hypothetical protein
MKKIGLILVGVALVVGTIINVNLNSQNNNLSEISLRNVEALGWGEDDGEVDCCPDKGDTCTVGTTDVKDYDEC